jgi:hypothetical protein
MQLPIHLARVIRPGKYSAAPLIMCAVLLAISPRPGSAQEVKSALPPVDSTKSISEAQRQLDQAVDVRVKELEKRLSDLEKGTPSIRTDDRVKILEQKVQLAEERNRIERTRTLGIARSKYTAGYKLVSDMQLKSQGLVAAGFSVSAYNSIADLTDLRKYPGFTPAFNKLLDKVGDNNEKSWLVSLIDAAIPKPGPTPSLASLHPIIGVAGFALTQLRNILPAFVRDKLKGKDLVGTYESLMCGLNSVTKLHDDLATLASLNARWTEKVDSLGKHYPSALGRYRTLVGAPAAAVSDAAFYDAVQKKFDEQTAVAPGVFLQFNDSIDAQNAAFEGAARAYYAAVSRHLEYWEQLRQVIMSRRDMPCMQNDMATQSRFNAAVTNTENAIKEIRNAYMFASTDRPENEYFRLVIGRSE